MVRQPPTSTPGAPLIDASVARELELAATAVIAAARAARPDALRSDGALRQALRRQCAAARRAGVRPEQLIVSLKTAWAAAPGDRRSGGGDGERDLLSRVVTLCIEEFYAAPGAP